MEEITKDEFILEVLKDELDSGKQYVLEIADIIRDADLSSERENEIRGRSFQMQDAFGTQLDLCDFFYKSEINLEELKLLYWCPKGRGVENDEIDYITKGTRQVKDILSFLEKEDQSREILEYIKRLFHQIPPTKTSGKRRLFVIEATGKKYIFDGIHRVAAIINSVVKGHQFEDVLLYVARMGNSS